VFIYMLCKYGSVTNVAERASVFVIPCCKITTRLAYVDFLTIGAS